MRFTRPSFPRGLRSDPLAKARVRHGGPPAAPDYGEGYHPHHRPTAAPPLARPASPRHAG